MSTWFTTLAAIRASDPDWEAIACYREPIARFLARVHPGLPSDLAQDVVQEVLCAMRTTVVARFDPDRGRFRDYLRGVIHNQVRRALAGRPQAAALDPDAVARVEEAQLESVDLEARLLQAVRRFHDGLVQGGPAERQVLYCLSDRLLDGLSYQEIADKEGLSLAAVKRRLQAARRGVITELLRCELEGAGLELRPRAEGRLAEAVQAAVASGRPVDDLARRVREPGATRVAQGLVDRVRAGVRRFPGLDSPDGQAFVTALRAILAEAEAERP